jgi:Papain-like cysteine protease AvrRpt2
MPSKFTLTQPPEVKQTSQVTCWAAALEAWLKVTKGRAYKSETDIIEAYKEHTISDPSRSLYNGIGIDGLKAIAAKKEIRMAYKVHQNLNLGNGADLSADVFRSLMKTNGHIYVVYTVAGGSHANVIYELDNAGSTTYPVLSVLDPGNGYQTKSFSIFASTTLFFYGWPEL